MAIRQFTFAIHSLASHVKGECLLLTRLFHYQISCEDSEIYIELLSLIAELSLVLTGGTTPTPSSPVAVEKQV